MSAQAKETKKRQVTKLRRVDTDQMADHIAAIVAQAPPISPAARAKLSAVLSPGRGRRAA